MGILATPTTASTTMVVGNFVFAASTAGTDTTNFALNPTNSADFDVTLDAAGDGSGQFGLGATLLVKNTNAPGTYIGNYNLVANYQ